MAGAESYLVRLLNTGRLSDNLVKSLLTVFRYQGLDEAGAYSKLYSLLEDYYRSIGEDELADQYDEAQTQLMQNRFRQ